MIAVVHYKVPFVNNLCSGNGFISTESHEQIDGCQESRPFGEKEHSIKTSDGNSPLDLKKVFGCFGVFICSFRQVYRDIVYTYIYRKSEMTEICT